MYVDNYPGTLTISMLDPCGTTSSATGMMMVNFCGDRQGLKGAPVGSSTHPE